MNAGRQPLGASDLISRLRNATSLPWVVQKEWRSPGVSLTAMSADKREFYVVAQVHERCWQAWRGQTRLAVGGLNDVIHAVAEREARAVAPY